MKTLPIRLLLLAAMAALPLRAQEKKTDDKKDDVVTLEKFVASEKAFDPTGLIPNRPVGSAFGFDKPIVEAPKAISVISTQQMESVGIRVSDDLVKVAPSTYSNFRYGLQGNISIRNQTSDFYFRGMKRIDPQGNFRTMWGANDGLEIVRGPASPIFGLGRIGGYVNFIPKTARATTGKYLESVSGNERLTIGAYDKKILSVDVAGPLDFGEKHKAGFAVYGYWEDSGSYFQNSFDKQQLIQTTLTVDLTRALRVETGFVFHHSNGGLPGGTNRTTHNQIQRDSYWSGGFSYQLDENRDGQISEREIRDSYFWGSPQLSAKTTDPLRRTTAVGPSLYYLGQQNEPFSRRLPWQGGAVNGGTITMAQFKAGYTDTAAAALGFGDPATGQARQRQGYQLMVYPTISDGNTVGAAGQVPNKAAAKQAFWMPPAYDLAPDTWVEKPWNERMGFGEDYYKANIGTFFFDLVNDYNPEWSAKNQILVDGHKQIKDGRNPFSQWQQVTSFEDKITYTRKMKPRDWWNLDVLTSLNSYTVWSYRAGTSPTDYDFRRDLQLNDVRSVENTFTPNDKFYSVINKAGYEGSAISSLTKSRTTVSGVGLLTDQTFFDRLNIMTGFRYDYVDAYSQLPAGWYERGGGSGPATLWVGGPAYPYTGTGLFVPESFEGRGNSSGPSMMVNVGYKLPWGLRPYVQAGRQTVLVNNASDQSVNVGTARNSLVGKSDIIEAGLKGSFFNNRLYFAIADYQQTRTSFDPISTVGGAASSTLTRGFEYEIRWLATKHLSLATTGTWSYAHYLQGAVVQIDGRSAGYPDVIDPATGKVLIPAEAFVWGGRLSTAIPDSDPRFRKVEALPATVSNFTATYTFNSGFFVQTTVLHQGPQFVDRLQTMRIPQGTLADLSFGIRRKRWEIYANVVNVFDKKLYTRGVTELLIGPKFARNFDITMTRKF